MTTTDRGQAPRLSYLTWPNAIMAVRTAAGRLKVWSAIRLARLGLPVPGHPQ